MKRISIVLGFIAALFTMVSCQKDQNFIRASITPYHGDEKVHLNSTNYACWDGDEYIWINQNEYPITAITGDAEHFLIDMGSNKPAHEGDPLNAVYHPSTVSISNYNSTNNTIDIDLPDAQTYTEDNNGNQVINAPMVATAEINSRGGADLIFSNVCALLKVQLQPNVIVYWIEVTSDNAPLAGTGTLNITDTSLTMTGNTQTVKLIVNNENNLANPKCRADGVYYIVLPPYMGSNLTVTVYDNPKTLMTFAQNDNGGHTLNASEIGVIDVNRLDAGRGLFSVDTNGTLVSFAPGNLTGSYSFTQNQTDQGTVYTYSSSSINTYSNAMGNQWFILSSDQWSHLVSRTDTYNGQPIKLVARASVNGQEGLVLLPDGYYSTMGCPVSITDDSSFPEINTTGHPNNWATMENYGVAFLPIAEANKNHYWTSTPNVVLIIGTGNGAPVGGSGTVAETGHGTTYENPYIRLAHIVQQGTSTSSAK